MCIPIPIIFGCPTHIKPEGDEPLQLCPRCHNTTVVSAKSTSWFELFWIPLIPFSRKRILICSTCQWTQDVPKGGQVSMNTTEFVPPPPGTQPVYTGTNVPKI